MNVSLQLAGHLSSTDHCPITGSQICTMIESDWETEQHQPQYFQKQIV